MNEQYNKHQNNNGLLKDQNMSRDIDSSVMDDGGTGRTYGNKQGGTSRYAASQKDPMIDNTNPMVDDEDYIEGPKVRPVGVAIPPLGMNESLEGKTEYTQMTKTAK